MVLAMHEIAAVLQLFLKFVQYFRCINTNLEGCSISSQISYILFLDIFSVNPATKQVTSDPTTDMYRVIGDTTRQV
jgi:hypothetical protein